MLQGGQEKLCCKEDKKSCVGAYPDKTLGELDLPG